MTPQTATRNWILFSALIFVGVEVLLGGVVSRLITGKFIGHVAALRIEALLILASYFVGGIVVALLSPTVRIYEPAAGAAIAVAITFTISLFTPVRFFGFSLTRILMGGGVAFFLALSGAKLGERLAAWLGNKDSREFIDRQ
jgi:hypothetical protein